MKIVAVMKRNALITLPTGRSIARPGLNFISPQIYMRPSPRLVLHLSTHCVEFGHVLLHDMSVSRGSLPQGVCPGIAL